MKLILTSLFVLIPLTALPQQTDVQSANVIRIVRIKYGIAQKIADLVLPGSYVAINADNYSNVIVLKGDSKRVASAEQTIHELDVPRVEPTSSKKNIELLIFIIGGFDKAEFTPENQSQEVIAPVIKQMRAIFPYKNYQLLSSMLLRSSEGAKAASQGSFASPELQSQSSQYGVDYQEINVSIEEGKPSIHLRRFNFNTNVAIPITTMPNTTQFQKMPVSIETDVDLHEGQKIVVGKANVGNSNLALFVVITARLVD